MYRVTVTKNFSSAHNLRGYEGNCENLHGHNWVIKATLKGDQLDKIGMLVDFKVLKKVLNGILDDLDHKYLNEHPAFIEINPTSENIAKYLFEELAKHFSTSVVVDRVTVYENADSYAEYTAD